jgi:hypothetical protein
MLKFRDWMKLQESGTDSGCIATFSQPLMRVTNLNMYSKPIKVKNEKKGNLRKLPPIQ